jgi:HPt (histidine-containing phosphotransfer) domain-containing protein
MSAASPVPSNARHQFLSIDRAMEFIGDAAGVKGLLVTLQQTLSNDLPRIDQLLAQDDVPGANRILHQLKGFTPVFCVDSLVEQVVSVEGLSKHGEPEEVRQAYGQLAPHLEQLRAEVTAELATGA